MSTGEARRALYERARNALVAQLRSNQPALFEAQITKERLALEEAIRKVEAEATRKSHDESQAEQQAVSRAATSRAPTPEAVPQFRRAFEAPRRDRNNPPPTDMPRAGWTVPSARERLLSSRSSLKKRGVKDFGDVVGEVGAATAKATQTAVSPASGFEPEPAVCPGNPGTQNDRDVVPTPQYRQGAGGQPHDRDKRSTFRRTFPAGASPTYPAS